MQDIDFVQFEREWKKLGNTICQSIYTDPRSQKLKASLQEKGFLSLEEKSSFLDICDSIKYETIYAVYGAEGSEGYDKFQKAWNFWFQNKGVGSAVPRTQRNCVDHILFGSTPVPEEFLLNFDSENPQACGI